MTAETNHGGKREGAGRKRKGAVIQVKLRPEQKEALAAMANEESVSLTSFVISVLVREGMPE